MQACFVLRSRVIFGRARPNGGCVKFPAETSSIACACSSCGASALLWFNFLLHMLALTLRVQILSDRASRRCAQKVRTRLPSLTHLTGIVLFGGIPFRAEFAYPLYQLSAGREPASRRKFVIGSFFFIGFVFHKPTTTPTLTQVISRTATVRYAFHRQQQWNQQATRLSPTPPGQRGLRSSATCRVTLPRGTLSSTN